MCGIIGIISKEDTVPSILAGLRQLEYRGYDSAGIATIEGGDIVCRRAKGKIAALEKVLDKEPISGNIGIGHTRWATHGTPSRSNAHPHTTDKVAVVHNGIIENYIQLKKELEAKEYHLTTDTDTEVIPYLITDFLRQGLEPKDAVYETLKKLKGAFAIGVLFTDHEDLMIAARHGSPLVVGYGEGEMYLASDAYALSHLTQEIGYLEDGDWAEITHDSIKVYDKHYHPVSRDVKNISLTGTGIGKGDYRHFMLKEIFEQPTILAGTLQSYVNLSTTSVLLPNITFDLTGISKISIIACGTSYYAGMTAKYWLESYAKIATEVHIASEFRYSNAVLPENGVALFISQSGETADTLAALEYAKSQNQKIISIVNVPESSMARASDVVLPIYAGPEIGVASTKAFTAQLLVLSILTLAIVEAKETLSEKEHRELILGLMEIPAFISEILQNNNQLKSIAKDLSKTEDILYIGRGTSYPIAMEGALKLKEISYIHAEGIAAGELKHGTIALVDENIPVITLAPSNALFQKIASNVEEVAARDGNVILISDTAGIEHLQHVTYKAIELPKTHDFIAPILYAIPIQLLAYHTAVYKGTDVDQPRNLAKSVTVE